MSAVPVLQDEIIRKSFDTMEWLFEAYRNATISEHQFKTGVDALFMATGGLTDQSVMELVSAASSMTKGALPVEHTVLYKVGKSHIVRWAVGDDFFTVRTSGDYGIWQPVKRSNRDSAESAREGKNKVIQMLMHNGFVEI